MDAADAMNMIGAVVGLVAMMAILVSFVIVVREGREDGRHPASDPCDGAYRESLLMRDETGYLTPEQAAAFLELLEAEPEPLVKTHCPACIIAMCDEMGIPLEMVRTAGKPKYCRDHKHSILAHARQGA